MVTSPTTLSIASGTLFIQSRAVPGLPQSLGLETEPLGPWHLITNLSVGTLEERLAAAGWHFCSIPPCIDAVAFGCGSDVLDRALQNLFEKAAGQDSNVLEITAVASSAFLGVKCLSVSAVARHLEKEPVSRQMLCAVPGVSALQPRTSA
ncbi:MAG TPA: hypothetical protein VJP02_11435 [Candidatus Sulfotelmatobacter sp.]|nr:hypothetical protein [Candidatus Sulfotelmatobacter sp.]